VSALSTADRAFYGLMGAVLLVCAIALIVMAVTGEDL
jgi:hypothetical protein